MELHRGSGEALSGAARKQPAVRDRRAERSFFLFTVLLFGLDVDNGLGDSRQGLVSVLFFGERFFQELHRLVITEFFGPGGQCPVARNLVMLDRLRRGEKARIKGRHSLEFLHDLGAFLGDAIDRGACLAARGFADDLEHAVKALQLVLRESRGPAIAALDDASQKKLAKLRNAKPEDFASEYDPMQVSAHKDAVSLFERYANGGQDPKLKDWAGRTLPALKHHLEMAQALDKNRK